MVVCCFKEGDHSLKEGLIDRLGGLSEAIDCLYDMIENSSEKEKAENVSDNNRPL